MTGINVEALRANPLVRDLLAGPFEFIVCDGTGDPVWFTVAGSEVEPVAEDGGGGVYVLAGPERHVLHVSADGRAAVIAKDLDDAVALVVACPYWRDLIKFSGGDLARMRHIAGPLEEAVLEEYDRLDGHRAYLRSTLGLPEPADFLGELHRCATVLGSRLEVFAPDGHRLPSVLAGTA
jgi:hypothetical protein